MFAIIYELHGDNRTRWNLGDVDSQLLTYAGMFSIMYELHWAGIFTLRGSTLADGDRPQHTDLKVCILFRSRCWEERLVLHRRRSTGDWRQDVELNVKGCNGSGCGSGSEKGLVVSATDVHHMQIIIKIWLYLITSHNITETNPE